MYEPYYGLSASPFRLAPDPHFFYESTCHKRGLAYLRYGLQQGQGFVVVTGVPGTGKSLLVQTIFSELAGRRMVVASINNTNLEADDTLRAVANSFDVYCTDTTKAALLNALEKFLIEKNRQGKRVLLIVDEAQNLPLRSLEELRMLSNFQRGDQPLLQIMLLGQQQLQQKFADPNMEQFTQRVIASCHLKPLEPAETRGYIEYRLRHVGWQGNPAFTGEALGLIHLCSRGIPRLINTFCDRLLLASYLDEKSLIDADHVTKVLQELKSEVMGGWKEIDLDLATVPVLAPLPEGVFKPSAPHIVQRAPVSDDAPVATSLVDKAEGESRIKTPAPEVPRFAREDEPVAPVAERVIPEPAQKNAFVQQEAEAGRPVSYLEDGLDVELLPLTAGSYEDEQPAAMEYKDHDAILVRRWWVGTAIILMAVIIVLLMVLFLGSDNNSSQRVGSNTSNQPAAIQKPVVNPVVSPASTAVEEAMPQSLNDAETLEPITMVQEAVAPLRGAPVVAVVPAPLSVPPSSREPAVISEPDRGQLERSGQAVAALKPSMSDVDLPGLMTSFAFAYESGDIDKFSTLFGVNAAVDSSVGRNKVLRSYQELFSATETRRIKMGAVKWRPAGAMAQGSSEFEITIWRRGDEKPSTVKGRLDIEVSNENGQLQIQKLTHVVSR